MYCPYCDERIKRTTQCPKCGEPVEFSEQNRFVALFLALFLGMLGVHDFYAGYDRLAVFKCLLSILFCWSIVVPVAVWVWGMIEAINMVRGKKYDSEGKVLK
jgi:TM2 domain-containing membrane protein YozV